MEQANKKIRRIETKLKPLFTCGICHNIFDRATALNECLHTFCWKCIHGKITEEDCRCCPVCNVDLGPKPLEKLRHDFLLEEMKEKIFTSKQNCTETESKTSEGSSSSSTNMKDLA